MEYIVLSLLMFKFIMENPMCLRAYVSIISLSIYLHTCFLGRKKLIIARKCQIREDYMSELQTYEAKESKTKMKTRGSFIFIKFWISFY